MPNKSFREKAAGWFKRKGSREEKLTAKPAVFHNPVFGLPQDPGEGGASGYWDVSSSVGNSGDGSAGLPEEGGHRPQGGGYLDVGASAEGAISGLPGEDRSPPDGDYFDVGASAEGAISGLPGEDRSPPDGDYFDVGDGTGEESGSGFGREDSQGYTDIAPMPITIDDLGLEAGGRSAGFRGGTATAVLPPPPVPELVARAASSDEDGLTEVGLTAEAFRKLVEDRLSRDHIERIVAVHADGHSTLATIQQKERLLSILQGSEEMGAADYLAALHIVMHQLQGEDGSRTPHQVALLGAVKHCSESSSANQNHLVASLAMSRVAILMANEERRLTSSEVSKVVKSISVDGTQIKQNCADRSEVEKTFEVLAKDDSITSYFLNVHESSGEIPMQGKHLVEYLQGAARGIASNASTHDQVFKLTQDKQDVHLDPGFTSEQMFHLVRIADILQKKGEIAETDRLTAIVDKVGKALRNDFTIDSMRACDPGEEASARLAPQVGGSAGGGLGRY
jgi:hypothetical protein